MTPDGIAVTVVLSLIFIALCLICVELWDIKWYISQLWKSLPAKEWWYETQSKIGGR